MKLIKKCTMPQDQRNICPHFMWYFIKEKGKTIRKCGCNRPCIRRKHEPINGN